MHQKQYQTLKQSSKTQKNRGLQRVCTFRILTHFIVNRFNLTQFFRLHFTRIINIIFIVQTKTLDYTHFLAGQVFLFAL